MKYFLYCRKSTESEDRQVLSIDSQVQELTSKFGNDPQADIVEVFNESYSAKAPGRPIFERMLTRIEKGDADGIISWHPDRLARNSIDGGRIIYLLDKQVIKDLKFSTFTFENNPQGKFMLSIIFGYSKYYVDSLSENIKRGIRAKLSLGWRPNVAPVGYSNERITKTILPDPQRFPLIQRIFRIALSGGYSVPELHKVLHSQWGFRTPRRRKTGGGPLALSTLYTILGNPFYAGYIRWHGILYPGKHEAMISWSDFERLQVILNRPGTKKPQRHEFAYTGMIRCGECGRMVTAEHRVNRQGHRYTYYHCTKRAIGTRCGQPHIEVRNLESQILDYLEHHIVPPNLVDWTRRKIEACRLAGKDGRRNREAMLQSALAGIATKQRNLTEIRLRELIDDAEYMEKRRELQREALRIEESLIHEAKGDTWFEPAEHLVEFSNRAISWFAAGNPETKRLILGTLGSNLTLKDKILNFEATELVPVTAKNQAIPIMWRWLEDVRTRYENNDPELLRVLVTIRTLKEQQLQDLKEAA